MRHTVKKRVILFLLFFITNALYFGSNPNDNLYLFFIYLFSIVWFFLHLIIFASIRTLTIAVSEFLIKQDIDGSSERAFIYDINITKFLYFSTCWIIPLNFMLLFPLAKGHNYDGFFLMLTVIFIIYDFSVRQFSIKWAWKNNIDGWEYSFSSQIYYILRHLVLSPLLIIIPLIYGVEMYSINNPNPELPTGWGWYVFSSFGLGVLVMGYAQIYYSLTNPKKSWEGLVESTREELR